MKGSSIIAATALSSSAQAAFIPETNFTLAVTQPGSDEASPVVVGCDGVLVTDPSNDNVLSVPHFQTAESVLVTTMTLLGSHSPTERSWLKLKAHLFLPSFSSLKTTFKVSRL